MLRPSTAPRWKIANQQAPAAGARFGGAQEERRCEADREHRHRAGFDEESS